MKSVFLNTLIADLSAGESWLEKEAESIAHDAWSLAKPLFVALEPAAAQILMDAIGTLEGLFQGKTIEEVESALLNELKGESKDIFLKLGSGLAQTLIAALKVRFTI